MKLSLKTFAVLFMCTAFIAGCSRTPPPKTSQKIIQKYFTKYGKKYKDTAFGKSPVDKVEITSQYEIHKYMIGMEAFITFKDGSVQRVNTTIDKGPLGWRFVSWEDISGTPSAPQ